MIKLGIYGYECCELVEGKDFTITPIYSSLYQVTKLASDRHNYHLTAYVEFKEHLVDLKMAIKCLEGVLSFIDQRDVIIYNPVRLFEDETQCYPDKIVLQKRHVGASKLLPSDLQYPNLRSSAIRMLYEKLRDKKAPDYETFGTAFFKCIETFRGRECFLDINYFLLFSALEALSKANSREKVQAEISITNFLKDLGFQVEQTVNKERAQNLQDTISCIDCYVQLRNKAFHHGELSTRHTQWHFEMELSYYYPYFRALLPLVLLRYVGFQHESIELSRWTSNDRIMI
ncbi:hypothetical protein ACWLRU_003051 [Vibrio parahaemolyticus]|nr:hypothetical protein [Vibrio parahaemolyticus]EIV8660730.1 hypothetical protein [Vibrio parahaemolyticus]